MLLRRIKQSDLETLFNMRNDPGVYAWCRQYAPLHWKKHQEWYEWQAKDPHTEMFVIERFQDVVGCCGLTSIDYINSRAEFSLYIGKEHQDKGYGRQALQQLFSFGFRVLGLNLIFGETFEGNPAAKMFEEIGMEKEGVRRDFYKRGGRFIGATLYSLRAADFNPLRFAATKPQWQADGPERQPTFGELNKLYAELTSNPIEKPGPD